MIEDQLSDTAVPADPAAERCRENARRLQLVRKRLAERSEHDHGPDERVLAAGETPD